MNPTLNELDSTKTFLNVPVLCVEATFSNKQIKRNLKIVNQRKFWIFILENVFDSVENKGIRDKTKIFFKFVHK